MKYRGPDTPKCLICGMSFIPGLYNPNVCLSCRRNKVAKDRAKNKLNITHGNKRPLPNPTII